MNTLSLAAADIVYQMRDEFIPRIQMTVAERQRMFEQLKNLREVEVFPSQTNFLLIRYEKAAQLQEYLDNINIGVRYFSATAPGLKNCLRISIGTMMENDEVFKAIKNFVEGK
jgi:histidinol-phosphate aminotransferase